MPTPQALIDLQRTYRGYREGPNNATIFGTWIGIPNAAWCDSFQHMTAYQLGFRFPGSQCGDKGDASVGFTIAWHKARGLWSKSPKVGSFVTYDWRGRGNWNDFHIELVIDIKPNQNLVIGGNVNDTVVEQWRSSSAFVTGYCHLPYDNVIPTPVHVPNPPAPAPPATNPTVQGKLSGLYRPFRGRNLTLTSPFMRGGPAFDQDVWRWQAAMVTRGWSLGNGPGFLLPGCDNVFGPISSDVAKKFQREKGLVVDGIVGPTTWHTTFFAPVT